MATKSFTMNPKFNNKSATKLLYALENAQHNDKEIMPPSNMKTIKIRDKDSMASFIRKSFVSDGN